MMMKRKEAKRWIIFGFVALGLSLIGKYLYAEGIIFRSPNFENPFIQAIVREESNMFFIPALMSIVIIIIAAIVMDPIEKTGLTKEEMERMERELDERTSKREKDS